MSGSGWKHTYCALLVLRCCSSLGGSGYIHPDEFFQNGEVMAGQIFELHAVRTWEWDSAAPCRSIIPAFLTTGLPYELLRFASQGEQPSPRLIFSVERAAFLLLSSILDYCLYRLVPAGRQRLTAMVLLASSYTIHTFQIRPFSNSIEAVLVALSLVILQDLMTTRSSGSQSGQENGGRTLYLTFMAALLVLGVFTRLTFIAFALPIAIETIKWTVNKAFGSTPKFSIWTWARLISLPLLVAIGTTSAFTVLDTVYFRGDVSTLILTPLNFLLYNLSHENLAEHGLHPRWLHIAVNLPMIVGPGLLYYGVISGAEILGSLKRKDKADAGVVQVVKKTSLYIVTVSMAILSIQPHQEPRFLTPLLVPFILLAVQGGRIERAGKLFWTAWVIWNVVLGLLFGVLHQGGVVPSLFYLHDQISELRANPSADVLAVSVFYWKTYMPPRHLLSIEGKDVLAGTFSLTDLSGAPSDVLIQNLLAPALTMSNGTTFLVTPPYALQDIPVPQSSCFSMRKRVFPHLDLDHLPESLELGWKDGLSLGVYHINTACVRRESAEDMDRRI